MFHLVPLDEPNENMIQDINDLDVLVWLDFVSEQMSEINEALNAPVQCSAQWITDVENHCA